MKETVIEEQERAEQLQTDVYVTVTTTPADEGIAADMWPDEYQAAKDQSLARYERTARQAERDRVRSGWSNGRFRNRNR